MLDLAEIVLRAMWDQAEAEGRHLYVDETHLGHAIAGLGDGYGHMVKLTATGDGHMRVEYE
jgi:hypothetical protein